MPDRSADTVAEKLGLVSYTVEIRAGLAALGPGVGPTWHVRALQLEEELNAPFRLAITLLGETKQDVRALVGGELALHMERDDADGSVRPLHGIVLDAAEIGRFSGKQHVRLRVGPRLELARLSVRSRIFQGMTVVDIVRAVLDGQYDDETLDASRLQHDHAVRDYCVQFRETDLAFVQRILAEDGIAFTFDHTEGQERMVLLDDASSFRGAGGSVFVGGDPQAEPLLVPVSTLGHVHAEQEHATQFAWKRAVHPTSGVLEQWDWKAAAPQNFAGVQPPDLLAPWMIGEQVLFGDRRVAEADGGEGPHVDDSMTLLRRHLSRRQREAELGHGSTNALGLAPGTTFDIEGHPDRELDRTWYVTRAIHRADCPEADIHEGSPFAGANYENEVECVPVGVPFHARVPAKPRVFGPQTATVVGPSGEEIHTDVHGRIQVRMHWDREQRELESGTSAWLRVAHGWAGPGWGTIFIPRVGMEVVVAFLDGDPDRPMCVGCVYNGRNTPPYALPDEKTKSTIKTRSTPGGEGSNELRFEDARGAEEIYVHAQRDLRERVEHEHRMSVGASQSIEVGGSRSLHVHGSNDTVIGGAHSVTVDGEAQGGGVAPYPAHLLQVTGAMEQHVSKTLLVRATEEITLECGDSVVRINPSGILLQSQTGATVNLTAAIEMMAKGGALTMALSDDGSMKAVNKLGSTLEVDAALHYASPDGAVLRVDTGHALTTPGAGLEITDKVQSNASEFVLETKQASLQLTDAAKLEGTSAAELRAGAGVEAGPGGVKVVGLQVDVNGAAAVSVVAPNVKIN